MKNNKGMSGVVVIVGLVLTSSLFYAFIALVTRLHQDYIMTKNRGESYLCFHYGKEEMRKYVNRIGILNDVIIVAKLSLSIPVCAATPPCNIIFPIIIKAAKLLQEGIKMLYVAHIWQYPYCDIWQASQLIATGIRAYQNKRGIFKRAPIVEVTMFEDSINRNNKIDINLHNLRVAPKKHIFNSDTFILSGEIELSWLQSSSSMDAKEISLSKNIYNNIKSMAKDYINAYIDKYANTNLEEGDLLRELSDTVTETNEQRRQAKVLEAEAAAAAL